MIDRSKNPAPYKDFTFVLPEINIINLENGLEVYHVKKEKLPIVQTTVISSAGSKYDSNDKLGLGFLTSLLIDEGAGEYDALELNNEIEKLGTISSININHDTLSLSILSLKENYKRSLQLLAKIILEPHFEEKDFKREKKKMLDKILQLKDEPSYIASVDFEKLIYQNTNYSFPEIGYEETVAHLSLSDVTDYYQKIFLQTNAKVVIVGNINENEIINLFSEYFYSFKANPVKKEIVNYPLSRSKKQIFFIHKKDSAQSELRVGHISKNRQSTDYYASKIMNTILGGQFSSRINLNLRENKGFTYGASSSFQYNKSYGNFEISTSVNTQNTGESISEIIYELNMIRQNISDEEINFAKSYLIKQFPSRFETYSQTAKNITPLILHSLPKDYYKNYTKKLLSVTSEEIRKSAAENIFPDEIIILVVGDKDTALPQVQNLYEEPPIELNINGELIS